MYKDSHALYRKWRKIHVSYNKYEIMKAEINKQLISDKITLKKIPGTKDPYVRRSELNAAINTIRSEMKQGFNDLQKLIIRKI